MVDNDISTTGITTALGTTSSIKKYTVQSNSTSNILTLGDLTSYLQVRKYEL